MMKSNQTALQKSIELLAMRDHSEKELREKLIKAKFSSEEIEEAFARLHAKKYLDDEKFCQRQFDYLFEQKKMSVQTICQKLESRGFSRELVQNCLPSEKIILAREKELALIFLQKKFAKQAEEFFEEFFEEENFLNQDEAREVKQKFFKFKEKMKGFLFRHGFPMEIIADVCETFLKNLQEK